MYITKLRKFLSGIQVEYQEYHGAGFKLIVGMKPGKIILVELQWKK